jgi:hypothetical protein
MADQVSSPKAAGLSASDEKCSPSTSFKSPVVFGFAAVEGAQASAACSGRIRARQFRAFSVLAASLTCFLLLSTNFAQCLALPSPATALRNYARQATTTLLEVFQIYPPVLTVTPQGVLEITDGSSNATVDIINNHRPTCQQTLAVYSFANSYGAPFVGAYSPPVCSFNRVTWNLTVVARGRQFDRLGIVYIGDTEVFRTSTAEPTVNGIEWTYLKVGSDNALMRTSF